jgi:protein-tyrosine phosphatase
VARVDLHCHILPALDDGALDLDDALAMARQAERDGIAAVCATPHIRHDHDVRIAELPGRVDGLNEALRAEGVGVRVLTGGEVAETVVDGLSDGELRGCTLGGGGRWILLEPAPGPLGAGTVDTADALRRRGFATVLAHPERHPSKDLEARLREVVALGGLIQLTAAFVVDGSAHWFVERRLVHVLGSDAHSSLAGRRVELSAALACLGGDAGLGPHASWIAEEAPLAVVEGRDAVSPY